MVGNHGGPELQSERGTPEEEPGDERATMSDSAKPRVITVNGMSLSFDFEEQHNPGSQSSESDDEGDNDTEADEDDDADYVTDEENDDPTGQPPRAQAVAGPFVSSSNDSPKAEDDSEDEYDSESTNSDEEDEGAKLRERERGQAMEAYFRQLDGNQHQVLVQRLRAAGPNALYQLSATDFKIMTGYDRARHQYQEDNDGIMRTRPFNQYRLALRVLWAFKVFPALKIHHRNQLFRKRALTRAQKLALIATGAPPYRPSPLRESCSSAELDDTPD